MSSATISGKHFRNTNTNTGVDDTLENRDTGGRPAHRSLKGRERPQSGEVGVQLASLMLKKSLLLLRMGLPLQPLARRVEKNNTKLPSRPQYYNPDPVVRLFGRGNEAPVKINGVSTTSLVDTGATVTIINADFCEKHGLEIHSLDGIVAIAGTGGFNVPYLGYTVATLEFPHIPHYSEEVVMLLVSDPTAYTVRVPLQVGTRVISTVIESLTPDNIKHLDETWRQTYVGTLMSCSVQQRSTEKGDTFNLEEVKGPVKLKKEVELEPFEQKEVWGHTQVRGHSKRVVVCTESEELLMKGQVMCVNSKSDLLPHNS